MEEERLEELDVVGVLAALCRKRPVDLVAQADAALASLLLDAAVQLVAVAYDDCAGGVAVDVGRVPVEDLAHLLAGEGLYGAVVQAAHLDVVALCGEAELPAHGVELGALELAVA